MKKNRTSSLNLLDQWFLKNKPLIWRTRIHYVLFFSLLIHVSIFVAYHLIPMTTLNMPSTEAIVNFRIVVFVLGCFGLLLWGFSSLKIPIRSHRFASFLFTGLLYWLGVAAVCSTVWMASKAVDYKVAGLLKDDSIETYYKILQDQKEKEDDSLYIRESESQRWVKEKEFFATYEMPYMAFHKFKDKVEQIEDAKKNFGWLSADAQYQDLYWFFLIGLVLLPMVALLMSMIGIKTAISLGFAQFLVLVGILTIGTYHTEKYYCMLTLFLGGLVTMLGLNHKVIHCLRLFAATMIPVSMILLLENESLLNQLFSHQTEFVVIYILLTLVTTVFASFMSYLYYKKINQPQSA